MKAEVKTLLSWYMNVILILPHLALVSTSWSEIQMQTMSSSFFLFIRNDLHAVDIHTCTQDKEYVWPVDELQQGVFDAICLSRYLSHFPGVVPYALWGDQENDFRGGRGSADWAHDPGNITSHHHSWPFKHAHVQRGQPQMCAIQGTFFSSTVNCFHIYVIGCLYNWNLVIMNSFTNTAHVHQNKLSAVIMKEMVYARIIRLRHYTLLFFVVWDFHQARHWNTVQRHSRIFCLTLYIVYGNMPAEDNEEIISLPLPSAFLTTT